MNLILFFTIFSVERRLHLVATTLNRDISQDSLLLGKPNMTKESPFIPTPGITSSPNGQETQKEASFSTQDPRTPNRLFYISF